MIPGCTRRAVAVVTVALTCAHAQAAEPAPARQLPRLTVRVYDEPGLEKHAEPAERAMGELYARDERVRFVPFFELIDPPSVAPRALDAADLAVAGAERAFSEMHLGKAKALLKEALQAYQRHLPQLAARPDGLRPLVEAWVKLARTRFFDGDERGARDALRYAFVLDPRLGFDEAVFPPQMKKTVLDAKQLFDTLGPGTIVVDSDPPGATVYLNGVKLDRPTPTEPVRAPPGPNYISYQRRGYAPMTAIFENNGGGDEATAVQALSRYPKNPIAPLDRVKAQLDQTDTPAQVKGAAEALETDLLVLVRLGEADGGVRVAAYLYDVRPDRILKRATRTVPEDGLVQAAREVATEVLDGARLDGVWPPPAPQAQPEKRPSRWQRFSERMKGDFARFYRWKYFWWVVGGAAGAVVLSTAIGAGVAADEDARRNRSIVLLGGN